MNNKKGISLITLVLTIIILIILAGISISSLRTTNSIEKAKEAVSETDFQNYKAELRITVLEELRANPFKSKDDINVPAENWGQMKEYISSLKKIDKGKYKIYKGELVLAGTPEDAPVAEDDFVNEPELDENMIPVKYNGTNWVICTQNDKDWYDYSAKKWANVMLTDGTEGFNDKSKVGTIITKKKLGSMFVWIPRFAYSINKYKTAPTGGEGETQEIHDIKFLKGNTNRDIKRTLYNTKYDSADKSLIGKKTPTIVHPAFKFGRKNLTGIWVAKFEASMNENQTGHKNTDSTADFYEPKKSMIKSLPGQKSWMHITIGNTFFNCYNMNYNGNSYGLTKNTIPHLMKNIEWGAVACLTTSKYGSTPTTNKKGECEQALTGGESSNTNSYLDNISQSSTGNVYGIYDLNGGAWEYVAAYYDSNYQESQIYSTGLFDKLPLSGKCVLKNEYENFFDAYDASIYERDPDIHKSLGYEGRRDNMATVKRKNDKRKKIAQDRYNNMSKSLGDAMYEVTKEDEYSYYGVIKKANGEDTDGNYLWISITEVLKEGEHPKTTHTCTQYNNDFRLIGTLDSFMTRGGFWDNGTGSGIFASYGVSGWTADNLGFRPVIILK